MRVLWPRWNLQYLETIVLLIGSLANHTLQEIEEINYLHGIVQE